MVNAVNYISLIVILMGESCDLIGVALRPQFD